MTIIEKIKRSVEAATGLPFLYHAAGEINELIARAGELPVAYSFLIDSGTIDDVNGRYHERVTLAVMFCDKTEFDFNALENEQIIDRMKVKAYKWLQSLRMSNVLRIVSVNNTQRLYDNTTDILTGFAVNITIEDVAGVGECELPQVVIDVDKNGSYDVVGVDRVRVNVLPKLEELEVTQNGEYLPPTDIAGFSKVSVDVQPVLEELNITENGEYTPQDGVDGFSKVVAEFDTSSLPKVKLSTFAVSNECINEDGIWDGQFVDFSIVDSFTFKGVTNIKDWSFTKNLHPTNLTSMSEFVRDCTTTGDKQVLDLSNFDLSKVKSYFRLAYANTCHNKIIANWVFPEGTNKVTIGPIFYSSYVEWVDLTSWKGNRLTTDFSLSYCPRLKTIVGDKTIDDVINNNIKVFDGIGFNLNCTQGTPLQRPSLRAIINGLSDRSNITPLTLTLSNISFPLLEEEDIAIATSKNWTITYS